MVQGTLSFESSLIKLMELTGQASIRLTQDAIYRNQIPMKTNKKHEKKVK